MKKSILSFISFSFLFAGKSFSQSSIAAPKKCSIVMAYNHPSLHEVGCSTMVMSSIVYFIL